MTERSTETKSLPRVACILLNWNGWQDTIECLESLFRLNYTGFQVVVCDNASSDGSLERVKEWARGVVLAKSAASPGICRLTSPPVPKPIPYLELTREEAESEHASHEAHLVLIQVGANVGFAGGNNVGLRYALHNPDCEFFWMLNSDTVVDPGALTEMVSLMQERPKVGLCGSLNISYYDPNKVLVEGGMRYCSWSARVHPLPLRPPDDLGSHPTSIDFVNGASMLTSRSFLEQVGLMEESYFLYGEEPDWALRAKGKFQLSYSLKSFIYHKEGASIGTNPDRMKRSLLCEGYLSRNRVLFTKRFFPWALPTVVTAVCIAALHRLCLGDLQRARTMLTFMLKGLFCHTPRTALSLEPRRASGS